MTDPLEGLRDRGFLLAWDPMKEADLPEVAKLNEAIEHIDDTAERHSLGELTEAVNQSRADLGQIGVVGHDQRGSIVAFALDLVQPRDRNPRRVKLIGGVHPAWRDNNIGHALMEWQIAAARRWDADTRRAHHGPLKLVATADANLIAIRDLYQDYGLVPETWFVDAHRRFRPGEPPQLPQLAAPLSLLPYPRAVADAVRVCHNEAFATVAGSKPIGPAEWDESTRRPGAAAELSWVVMAGSRVVAYAMNAVVDDGDEAVGWTDRLGVLPGWRGRGLARSVLQASIWSFHERGLAGAGIGFDTDDPETVQRLTRAVGYENYDAVVAHALIVH